MKHISLDKIDSLTGKRIKEGDTFSFECHAGLGCFNQCCRNLNLFLYPYDVVRLKNRLEITSDRFLDEYVDVVLRPLHYFPDVLLKMSENSEKTCPFLTESGCFVYTDRPYSCRTFPVEQGAIIDAKTKKTNMVNFFRPPDFCMGKNETREWTVKEWIEDQDAVKYNEMTVGWASVKTLFQSDPWAGQGPDSRKGKMAFMAIYNVDSFRDFVFNSTFLKRYKVKSALLKKLKSNDIELMKFGFNWVKYFVWGIMTKHLRPRYRL